MRKGYKRIFWGVVIAHVSFSMGTFQLFPAFVGWLAALSGLEKLSELYEEKDLLIIKYSFLALVLLTLIEFVFSLFSPNIQAALLPLQFYPVVISAIELIAFHKIFEVSVHYFNEMNREEKVQAYTEKDKLYLLLNGAALILLTVSSILNNSATLVIGMIASLAGFVYLLIVVRSLMNEDHKLKV